MEPGFSKRAVAHPWAGGLAVGLIAGGATEIVFILAFREPAADMAMRALLATAEWTILGRIWFGLVRRHYPPGS